MKPIEPGEKFTVEYGNGHTIEATSLNARQQRAVLRIVHEAKTELESAEAAEAALRLLFDGITDEKLDTMNVTMQLEIIQKVISNGAVEAEDKKKSE